jgi:hypothetical protein
VSEYIKGLQDKGLIDILRGRDDQGHPERQIYLSARAAQLYAPDVPVTPTPAAPVQAAQVPEGEAGSAERTGPFGGANEPVRPSEAESKDINISHARMREAEALRARVYEAAGEALADPAAYPEIAVMRDLTYLLVDLPTAPACTADEIVDAARVLGKWFLDNRGPRSMTNFRHVRKKATEYRDARLAGGGPVKAPPKAVPSTADDPATYDADRWRIIVTRVAPKMGGWQACWGPEPGMEGTLVPQELWSQWKGLAA